MYYKYIEPSDRNIINICTCALCGGVTRASGLQSRVTRAKWHHSWLFVTLECSPLALVTPTFQGTRANIV